MSGRFSLKPGFCALAAAGLLFGGLLLALGIGLPWAQRNAAYDESIERSQDLLLRYQRLIDSLPLLQAKLEALKTDRHADAYYLDAQDAAQGGIFLQRRMEQFASASNTELSSIQIIPGKSVMSIVEVVVRMRMRTTTEALTAFLHKIEGSEPLLMVQQLNIRALARTRGQEQYIGVLDVNLDVSGYVRPRVE